MISIRDRFFVFLLLLATFALFAEAARHTPAYTSMEKKIATLEAGPSGPSQNVTMTQDELNAFFAEGGVQVPKGLSNIKFDLHPGSCMQLPKSISISCRRDAAAVAIRSFRRSSPALTTSTPKPRPAAWRPGNRHHPVRETRRNGGPEIRTRIPHPALRQTKVPASRNDLDIRTPRKDRRRNGAAGTSRVGAEAIGQQLAISNYQSAFSDHFPHAEEGFSPTKHPFQ